MAVVGAVAWVLPRQIPVKAPAELTMRIEAPRHVAVHRSIPVSLVVTNSSGHAVPFTSARWRLHMDSGIGNGLELLNPGDRLLKDAGAADLRGSLAAGESTTLAGSLPDPLLLGLRDARPSSVPSVTLTAWFIAQRPRGGGDSPLRVTADPVVVLVD